jgi:TolB-like protein
VRHKEIPLQEIGGSLGAVHSVDGSVRKSGDRVRIVARLMRVADASVLWSETCDLPWNDILALQDDIATRVTRAVEEKLE